MDYKKLMNKYWAGETSLEEEKLLKSYFKSTEIEEELIPFKSTFQYFDSQQKIQSPAITIDFEDKREEKIIPVVGRFNPLFLMRIAASVLFLMAIGFWYHSNSSTALTKEQRMAIYWEQKEIKDPILAYQKTKAALLLASNKLNKGTKMAASQVVKVKKIGKTVRLK